MAAASVRTRNAPTTRARPITCTLALMLVSTVLLLAARSTAADQPALIRTDVTEPIAYLAQDTDLIVSVQISNPSGSGRVITAIGGANAYSRQFQSPESIPGLDGSAFSLETMPCSEGQCITEGSLPVYPGESITIDALKATFVAGLPDRSRLNLSDIVVSMDTRSARSNDADQPAQRRELTVISDRNLARIITAQAPEPEDFGDFEVYSPNAGHAVGTVELEMQYPAQVVAGQAFNVTALIHNTGPVAVAAALNDRVDLKGSHAETFSYHAGCRPFCVLAGERLIEPGQSSLVDLGNFHYDGESLFPGTLRIEAPAVHMTEAPLLTQVLYPDNEAIEIEVTHNGPQHHPNPAIQLPERQPLQLVQGLIHDPNSGYDWLPLHESRRMSAEAINDRLGPGGQWEGFSVASADQVEQLILNQLHAAGVNARPHNLYQRLTTAQEDALSSLASMLGPVVEQNQTGPAGVGGVINNPSWLTSPRQPAYDVLSLFGYVTGFCPSSCLSRAALTRAAGLFLQARDNPGVWLVRTPGPKPQRPAERSSLYQDVLVIPSIEVNGQVYTITLERMDRVTHRMQVLTMEPAPRTDYTVFFDGHTGAVEIPDAVLMLPDGGQETYWLRLDYLPESEPPVLEATYQFIE